MIAQTKYDIGDKVYFLCAEEGKILQGEIDWIAVSLRGKSKKNRIRYHIKKITFDANRYPMEKVETFANHDAPEHQVFKDRADALDFAIKITDDI